MWVLFFNACTGIGVTYQSSGFGLRVSNSASAGEHINMCAVCCLQCFSCFALAAFSVFSNRRMSFSHLFNYFTHNTCFRGALAENCVRTRLLLLYFHLHFTLSSPRMQQPRSSYAQSRITIDIAGKLRLRPRMRGEVGYSCGDDYEEAADAPPKGDGFPVLAVSQSSPGGYILAPPPSMGAAARARRITADAIDAAHAERQAAAQPQMAQPASVPAAHEQQACPSQNSTPSSAAGPSPTHPYTQMPPSAATAPATPSAGPSAPPQAAVAAPATTTTNAGDSLLDEMFGAPARPFAAPTIPPPTAHPMPAPVTTHGSDFDPFATPPRPVVPAGATAEGGQLIIQGGVPQQQWGAPAPALVTHKNVTSIDDIFS